MKIAVCSDLHLEFGDLDLHNDEGADVLILGGDILGSRGRYSRGLSYVYTHYVGK